MLTGQVPFTGDAADRDRHEAPERDAAAALEARGRRSRRSSTRSSCARSRRTPADRYQSAEEFAQTSQRVEAGLPVAPETADGGDRAPGGRPDGAPTQVIRPAQAPTARQPRPRSRRRPPAALPARLRPTTARAKRRRCVSRGCSCSRCSPPRRSPAGTSTSRSRTSSTSRSRSPVPLVVGLRRGEGGEPRSRRQDFAPTWSRQPSPTTATGKVVPTRSPEDGARLAEGTRR